jgi:hypothetical protein
MDVLETTAPNDEGAAATGAGTGGSKKTPEGFDREYRQSAWYSRKAKVL